MRCSGCGCNFDEAPATDMHLERRALARFDMSRKNAAVPFYLCPLCAEDRAKTKRTFFWVFFIAVAVLLLIGIIAHG